MKRQDENKNIFLDTGQLLCEIEQLKRENSRLKHVVAEQALDISTLKQWNDFTKKGFINVLFILAVLFF